MRALGVDPGRNGAAVLVEQQRGYSEPQVVAGWVWTWRGGRKRPCYSLAGPPDGVQEFRTLSAVGTHIGIHAKHCGWSRDSLEVAVEALFVGRGKGVRSALKTAELAGEVQGPLVEILTPGHKAWRPTPSEWRLHARLPRVGRSAAKDAAIAWANERFSMTAHPHLLDNDHAAEALGMAIAAIRRLV